MPDPSWEKPVEKRLFLVCPTDRMEPLIRKKFGGEAFFCTALGVYFEFDAPTQYTLWNLIRDNEIGEVLLISAVDNVFYRQAFEKPGKHHYPVEEALAKTRKKIAQPRLSSGAFSPNLPLLAAHHLAHQQKRLLSTVYLGDHLTQENIAVKAYVYQPQEEVFYRLEEIEESGGLLSSIFCN